MKKCFFFLVIFFSIITNTKSQADWQNLPTGSTAYLTAVYFTDALTGYIGGINGFLSKTTDGGLNWINQNPNMPSAFVRSISFPNANTGYICGDNGILRKTTNGGLNWTTVFSGQTDGIYSIDAVDPLTFFATVTNGFVIKSTDGGASFNQFFVTTNQLLALDFVSRDTGYIAGQGGVVYKTNNSCASWIPLNASTLNNFWDICALTNSDIYLCAYYGTVRSSSNSGANFYPAYTNYQLFEDIQMVNTRIGYTCGLNGALNKTTDGGLTWYPQNPNTSESLNEIFFLNAQTGYIVGTSGTLLKTTNGGDNFIAAVLTPNSRQVIVSGSTFNIKWSSVFTGNAKLEFSTNNGSSWTVIQNSIPASSFEYTWLVPGVASSLCKVRLTSVNNPSISAVSNGTFSIVTSATTYNVPELLYYKFNDGSVTTPNYAVPGEVYGNAGINGMTLQNGGLADSSLVGGGGSGVTNFVNSNWATYLEPDGWTIGFWVKDISLGVDPNNAVFLFSDITANNLRCYYGGAGGLTAVDTAIMFRVNGMSDVRIPVVKGQTYYIHIVYDPNTSTVKVYKNGVLSQTESRPPFLVIGNGPFTIGAYANASSSLAQGMRLDEFRVYNRPLGQNEISQTWNVTIPYIITGVQNLNTLVPNSFKLENNYPNPFNPSTVIRYSLMENCFVSLKVYDVLGNEIAALVNEMQNRGSYNYQFSTANYQLSSGIYFYKIEAGSFIETKSMMLLK